MYLCLLIKRANGKISYQPPPPLLLPTQENSGCVGDGVRRIPNGCRIQCAKKPDIFVVKKYINFPTLFKTRSTKNVPLNSNTEKILYLYQFDKQNSFTAFFYSCSNLRYAMLMRPRKTETVVHRCKYSGSNFIW